MRDTQNNSFVRLANTICRYLQLNLPRNSQISLFVRFTIWAWRKHGNRDPDMFMPSLMIRAGDEVIFSPNTAQVWPEATGNPWRFHGFWARPKAGETPRRQAVRRGSMGWPVRSTPNHTRTAHPYPAGGRRNRKCMFVQLQLLFHAVSLDDTVFCRCKKPY